MAIPGGIPQPDVFSISPILQAHQAGTALRFAQEDRNAAEEQRMQEAISSMAYGVRDQAGWTAMLGALQRRFPDADLSPYADFSSRDMAIGQSLSVMDQFNMEMAQRADARAAAAAGRAGGPTQGQREASEWAAFLGNNIGEVTPGGIEPRTVTVEAAEPGAGEVIPGEFEAPTAPVVTEPSATGMIGALMDAGIPEDRARALAAYSLTEGGGPARTLMMQALAAPEGAAAPQTIPEVRNGVQGQRAPDGTWTAYPQWAQAPATPEPDIRPMNDQERIDWGIPANDTRIWAMNPQTNEPSVVGGNPSAGTRLEVQPDGTIVYAEGGTQRPPTVDQAGANVYAGRMEQANAILNGLETEGTNLWNHIVAGAPIIGNYLVSQEYQQYQQAQRNFITAVLRRESGAVITPEEFATAAMYYFPQPGNGPEVIAQKRATRELAIQLISQAAGPLRADALAPAPSQPTAPVAPVAPAAPVPAGAPPPAPVAAPAAAQPPATAGPVMPADEATQRAINEAIQRAGVTLREGLTATSPDGTQTFIYQNGQWMTQPRQQ